MINIITKAPKKSDSMVQSQVSEFGDTSTQVRWTVKEDRWAMRTSVGYESVKNSDQAGAQVSGLPALNGLMGFSSFQVRDFGRYLRIDSQVDVELNEGSKASFGAAHSSSESGDREFVGFFPQKDMDIQHTRLFTRWERSHSDSSSTDFQWYSNLSRAGMPQLADQVDYDQHDVEMGHHFQPSEKHSISMGGNFRWTELRSSNLTLPGELIFSGETDEYITGIYLVDRFNISSTWTLESQGRIDYFSETDLDWSARFALLRSLDAEKKHRVRVALARTFRVPNIAIRETTVTSLGGLYNIIPAPTPIKNETTVALEAGYTGQFSDHLNLRADVFFQHMEDIVGAKVTPIGGGASNVTLTNIGTGSLYGVELEALYHWQRGHASLWYAYHDHDQNLIDKGNGTRAYLPAPHKVELRTRLRLGDDWVAVANYVFNDAIPTDPASTRPVQFDTLHQLDLALTKRFLKSNAEITLGIRDVLNNDMNPVYDIGGFTSHTTPGRMLYLRGQIKTQ